MRALLTWINAAVWQFTIFFLINAYAFDLLPGSPPKLRTVALESWIGTFSSSLVLMLWLQIQNPSVLKNAIVRWLPVGLMASFSIATYFYIFSYLGERIQVFTPNPLIPPFWFLVFTLISFCWFDQMSQAQKCIRLTLFVFAGIMIVYASARFLMLAWLVAAVVLAIYVIFLSPRYLRSQQMRFLAAGGILVVGGVLMTDFLQEG